MTDTKTDYDIILEQGGPKDFQRLKQTNKPKLGHRQKTENETKSNTSDTGER